MSEEQKRLIRRVLLFPGTHVCKHWVALLLLDSAERDGVELPAELVEAVIDADDDVALRLLG